MIAQRRPLTPQVYFYAKYSQQKVILCCNKIDQVTKCLPAMYILLKSIFCQNRVDTVFEFPRPLMPNMVLVGGLNCHVRNPLPEVSNDFDRSTVTHVLDHLSCQMLFLFVLFF